MASAPTVFFIDDSATMREVIKIAFRRENINVVAYNDAKSALGQFELSPPAIVITDVIMPDKDGYEVCSYIKSHPSLNHTPVILMSGVVNKAVAEKAFSVKADELIRKPFQPQDLITRVKHLLYPNTPVVAQSTPANAAAALSSIFQTPAGLPIVARPRTVPPATSIPPMATNTPFTYPPQAATAPVGQNVTPAQLPTSAPRIIPPMPQRQVPSTSTGISSSSDIQKLKIEIMRLEGLVKKLQSELAAEREYATALEEHVKTLQEND